MNYRERKNSLNITRERREKNMLRSALLPNASILFVFASSVIGSLNQNRHWYNINKFRSQRVSAMNLGPGDINRAPFAPLPIEALCLGRSEATVLFSLQITLPELDMHWTLEQCHCGCIKGDFPFNTHPNFTLRLCDLLTWPLKFNDTPSGSRFESRGERCIFRKSDMKEEHLVPVNELKTR